MKLLQHTILIVFICFNGAVLNAQTTATVIRVIDGDTYQMLKAGRVFTVRLANVDAPESKQAFGGEATKNATALLLCKTVLVDSISKDRYGRTIASITVNDMALDSLLVSNGWAWHYEAYSNNIALENLQAIAINKRLGLWQCGSNKVCPPWVYRNLNNKNRAIFCSACNTKQVIN